MPKKPSANERIVFALLPTDDDQPPVILIGFPDEAIKKMRRGEAHNFDMTSVGIPLRMMFYSEKTHGACMKIIEDAAKKQGIIINDMRNKDLTLKPEDVGQ